MRDGVVEIYKKFEKGSEEWQFFMDYWQFRQKYYAADNEDWFLECMNAGEEIMEKYVNTAQAKFVQSLIFSHFEDVERRWRGRNEQT